MRCVLWKVKTLLLKGPCPDLLTDGLTHSELQHWGSCLRGAGDIWGDAELSGFKSRVGGMVCSRREVHAEAIVPLLSPPPSQPADAGIINLDNTGRFAQGIP